MRGIHIFGSFSKLFNSTLKTPHLQGTASFYSTRKRQRIKIDNVYREGSLSAKEEELHILGRQGGHSDSFAEVLASHRHQAQRTFLVVKPRNNEFPQQSVLNRYGAINKVYEYDTISSNDEHKQTLWLVEYRDSHSANNLLRSCTAYQRSDRWLSYSRMLWMPRELGSRSPTTMPLTVEKVVLSRQPDLDQLKHCQSLSQQMELLYDLTRLTEFDTRMHHFLAASLELSLSPALPTCRLVPFGSCVNGFGRTGCDLDLVAMEENPHVIPKYDKRKPSLCFTSLDVSSDRDRQQIAVSVAASMLRQLAGFQLPPVVIKNARIPIVRTKHSSTGLEVDVSFFCSPSVLMSEILWTFGELDPCVRPLVFTIKHWAKCQQITDGAPGRFVSNFQLVVMAIAFLQQQQVLPPLRKLAQHSGFHGNTRQGKVKPVHQVQHIARGESLDSLLPQFFHTYSRYPFDSQGICLWSGEPMDKPMAEEALYVKNPIEQDHNIGKNVAQVELDKFQVHCQLAYEKLQNSDPSQADFGLLSLFESDAESQQIVDVINRHDALKAESNGQNSIDSSLDDKNSSEENPSNDRVADSTERSGVSATQEDRSSTGGSEINISVDPRTRDSVHSVEDSNDVRLSSK